VRRPPNLPDDHHCPWREYAEALEPRVESLERAYASLEQGFGARIAGIESRFEEQEGRRLVLEAEVARLEKQLLGKKSERAKIPPPDVEDDDAPSEEAEAKRREEIAAKRRERAMAKASQLVSEELKHPLDESDKRCPRCGKHEFSAMPPERSVSFEYVPGHFVRRVHVQEKVACRCGECVLTASIPVGMRLVPGSHYGPGFAAFLIVEKCADSIPIHRIEKRFERMGIPLSRSTMNDLLHTAADVVGPLVERLKIHVAKMGVVLADETSLKIQDKDKRGFVWVFHGRDDVTDRELVLYLFGSDRSGETPKTLLGGTIGSLVVDGYTGYNDVTDVDGRARGGCWSHARRKLIEAVPAEGPHRDALAREVDEALDLIRELFRVEQEALVRDIVRTPEHLELRRTKSKAVLDALEDWVKKRRAGHLPKSPMGIALGYIERQWPRLTHFLSDARVPIHNNASERRLRVIALGRKNYLFVGNTRAGERLAGLYSLVGSCIANGIEPTEYLTDVLARVQRATSDDDLDALLPDRWSPA
jgi:transposase